MAFFEAYHLYIVDICVKHNPFFHSRLIAPRLSCCYRKPHGNMVNKTESGKIVTYAYTSAGDLGSVKLNSGLRYDDRYDSLGRLITSSSHDTAVRLCSSPGMRMMTAIA
jgi:hypothetical protein